MTRRLHRNLLPLFVLFLAAGPAFAAEGAPAEKANAADLIQTARRLAGNVVETGRAVPQLAAGRAEAKPFWEAMKQLRESLGKAREGLAGRSDDFFARVAASRAAVEQAEIALIMSGASSPALDRSMGLLAAVVTKLDEGYSKEAARLAQGGELTAKERKQLDELKAKQAELDKKLDLIDQKAGKNAEAIRKGTKKIRKNSERIRNARYTTVDFVAAMTASRLMCGSIWGWHWWWGPWGYWGPGWINIDIIIWDDWIDAVPYDWAIADAYLDVAELELDAVTFDEPDLEAAAQWLDTQDLSMSDADFAAITDELDGGWDDVSTDAGAEILDAMQVDFDDMPFDPGFEMETFDDFGFDDFGGDFGDFGGDW